MRTLQGFPTYFRIAINRTLTFSRRSKRVSFRTIWTQGVNSKCFSDMGRVALGHSTPESWHSFSEKNRDEAEECIRISVALRDLIETDICDTSNDLESQPGFGPRPCTSRYVEEHRTRS